MTKNESEKNVPAIIPAVAGGISGMATRFICQPLDVLKIRFQLQVEPINRHSQESKYRSLLQACQLIFKEEGLRAFWKGHVPAQTLSLIYGVVQFGIHDSVEGQLKLYPMFRDDKTKRQFVSGFIAGCSATLISFPFDIVRTRLVVQGHTKVYKSTYEALVTILRKEGFQGWFRGLTPTLIQIGPFTGFNFALFYYIKSVFEDNESMKNKSIGGLSFASNMIAGSLSGFLAKVLVYPLDLSRRRLQLQGFHSGRVGFGKNFSCYSLTSCFLETIRVERTSGLFKGLFPSLLKAALVNGMIFTLYEMTYEILCNLYKAGV